MIQWNKIKYVPLQVLFNCLFWLLPFYTLDTFDRLYISALLVSHTDHGLLSFFRCLFIGADFSVEAEFGDAAVTVPAFFAAAAGSV